MTSFGVPRPDGPVAAPTAPPTWDTRPTTPPTWDTRPTAAPFAATTPILTAARRQPWKPPPPAPKPVRRPLRGVGVPRITCWQLALVAVILVLDEPWPTITAVATAAVVVVAFTAVRVRSRWLSEWAVLSAKYLLRNRDRSLPGDHPGQALLSLISPEATAGTTDVNDEPVCMVSRAAGITAVLHPSSTTRDLTKSMPAPQELLPAPDERALALAVQVVHQAGLDRTRPPRVWIALQVLRTVELHRDDDVRRALGNAVRRVRRRLRREGLPTRPLTEHETLGTLAALAHVNAGRHRVREQWRHWWSGPITQATFRLDGWDRLPTAVAPQLLRRLLTAAPQAAVTVSVTARRTPAGSQVEAVLRIATAHPVALENAATELARLARERGVDLERLDGEHTDGLAATLPIGAR
ncbi:type VII secretion protein EccE [Actinosynnema sp. CS-041913]|uniref:type VII secretion protein EccE n=1 Tax=Actinosynnema sp. CS-041913 TaxID=3239917 RepID=UPI003D92F6C1